MAWLFIDFVVLKKQGVHDIGVKEALNWSLVWVALSFLFNGLFWWAVKDSTGSTEIANTKSLEFLTGYLIEKSLAVDNIFVFLMICLMALTDVIFAVDSIPAIFAITSDPFIVLTSNVFAMLGLRAMYFLLAAVASKFYLLNYGLAVILVFIGTKMCLIEVYKIPVATSLGVVVGILVLTMWLSVRTDKPQAKS